MSESNTKMLIIGLTVATAVIHLALGFLFSEIMFILNGVGYLGLLGLMYLSIPALASVKQYARPVLIGYTALTVVLYFVINDQAFTSALGLIDKAIEIALIVLLVRQSR